MRISYSAIDTYKTCPLKYKFQEIDKIKVPKSKEAVFGTILHNSLKFLFSRDPLYPTLDEVLNFFQNLWANYKGKVVWSDEQDEKIYCEEGLKILKKFYAGHQPWNFNVLDLESRFETPLADLKTGVFHTLVGIIDRIDKPDDETYEIIDYKTGRRLPTQEKVNHNLQLSIYHLGLVNSWPEAARKKIRLTFHFLKHGEKISTQRSADDLEKTKTNVLETIREIQEKESTGDFPPLPSALCDWCGYKPICPVWKHLYKKTEAEPDEAKIQEAIKEYFGLKEKIQENTVRSKELQTVFFDYMRQKNMARLFCDEGYVSKTTKIAAKYDLEKVKSVLEPLGHWSGILKADEKKISDILPALPADVREQIKAATVLKTSEILTISRKKIS
ncbi:MAG: PD-(D/E)XK nuclease family protein [Patescibacteria group bacterium]